MQKIHKESILTLFETEKPLMLASLTYLINKIEDQYTMGVSLCIDIDSVIEAAWSIEMTDKIKPADFSFHTSIDQYSKEELVLEELLTGILK